MKDLEYYYWAGFVSADGTFLMRRNRRVMKVALATLDRNHLSSMKKYLGSENCWGIHHYPKFSELIWNDSLLVEKMQEKFDLKFNKTYNPPSEVIIDQMTDKQFLSFFIGYVDGDGCIQYQTGRKDCILSFRVHSSWLPILIKMHSRIEKITMVQCPSPKIMNDGYAKWCISNCRVLRQLKLWIMERHHPYLIRKWNKVQENKLSKCEWQTHYTSEVISLRNRGYTFQKIGKKLGLAITTVYMYYHGKNGTKHYAL